MAEFPITMDDFWRGAQWGAEASKEASDTARLDWLEEAYSRGGAKAGRGAWQTFTTDVALRGYRTAIDAAMKEQK